MYLNKYAANYPCKTNQGNDADFIIPNNIIFLKSTGAPWARHISKSTGFHYYFNPKTNEMLYDQDRSDEACENLIQTFTTRVEWPWLQDPTVALHELYVNAKSGCLNSVSKH